MGIQTMGRGEGEEGALEASPQMLTIDHCTCASVMLRICSRIMAIPW